MCVLGCKHSHISHPSCKLLSLSTQISNWLPKSLLLAEVAASPSRHGLNAENVGRTRNAQNDDRNEIVADTRPICKEIAFHIRAPTRFQLKHPHAVNAGFFKYSRCWKRLKFGANTKDLIKWNNGKCIFFFAIFCGFQRDAVERKMSCNVVGTWIRLANRDCEMDDGKINRHLTQ